MSLINEALKKAQRSRSGDAPGHFLPAAGGAGPRVEKRDQPRTAQQLVLIAAGAIALVVLSVVITVYLINQTPEPKPTAATPKPAAPAPVTSTAQPAAAVAPIVNPPALTTRPAAEAPPPVAQATLAEKPTPAPSPTGATDNPSAAPILAPRQPAATAPVVVTAPTATSVTVSPPPVAPPPATPPPVASAPSGSSAAPTPVAATKHDERISAFVDAIRVAGIRSSGTESRVLMNDRVYRVNEIVDRNFGLRLTKVETNTLTFTDANGVVYVKNF